MGVSVADLVAQTRLDSGLRNNRVWSDAQICSALTDGFWDLRDQMIKKFAPMGWFRKTYDFTLAGGNDGNVLDLSEVPDLELVQGLDFVDSSGNHYTVPMLTSFENRNAYGAVWPFGSVGPSFNGALGRGYYVDGDSLFVVPGTNAQGSHQLIYTPQAPRLAGSIDYDLTVDPAWSTGPPDFWNCAGAEFIEDMVGGIFLPDFDAPNEAYNIPYTIIAVPTATSLQVTPAPVIPGFTNPAAGTANVHYQAAGTIDELPDVLTPWHKYIVLYAARVIRAERRQPAGDLDMQFNQITARISAITKQRSQGVAQAPIRRGYNWGGRIR